MNSLRTEPVPIDVKVISWIFYNKRKNLKKKPFNQKSPLKNLKLPTPHAFPTIEFLFRFRAVSFL